MFCGQCGTELTTEARFCSACGGRVTGPSIAVPPAVRYDTGRLRRPRANRMVAGVCAGLAEHYGWDLTWVRVLTVLIALFSSGAGLIAYIVFWIVMPEESWMLPASTSTPGAPSGGA